MSLLEIRSIGKLKVSDKKCGDLDDRIYVMVSWYKYIFFPRFARDICGNYLFYIEGVGYIYF